MEAEVFRYGSAAVLKLYADTTGVANLRNLKAFYDSLNRERLPYALPRIQSVAQEEGFRVSI